MNGCALLRDNVINLHNGFYLPGDKLTEICFFLNDLLNLKANRQKNVYLSSVNG